MSRPLTVGELTSNIKNLLEEEYSSLLVEGEVSGLRLYPSGHVYFSLKDSTAVLKAVCWKSSAQRMKMPRDGDRVLASGRLSLYEPRGEYQMTVTGLRAAGQGDLQARFEELRRRLADEGLFDAARKRPLPTYPRRIAIVTSPAGAVLHDVMHVLSRRSPHVELVLVAAPVQGAEAVPGIVGALDRLARTRGTPHEPDVVIVARGGGSLEDLWAFNEEAVVRAVASCPFPVVSGVGHETDVTLCDLVADLRAPTPSAAAEIVAPEREELLMELDAFAARLRESLLDLVERRRERLEMLATRPCLRRPLDGVERAAQKLDITCEKLDRAIQLRLERENVRLGRSVVRLEALSPLKVLARGYAAVENGQGQVLTSASGLGRGDLVKVLFRDGRVDARIESVERASG